MAFVHLIVMIGLFSTSLIIILSECWQLRLSRSWETLTNREEKKGGE
jgi:hypothetical protein